MTTTYGPSPVRPEDIVSRIDELIPRDEITEVPLVWRARNVDTQVLIAARNEILRLRARVEVLERACQLIQADPDPHVMRECSGCYRHSRLAFHALEAKP